MYDVKDSSKLMPNHKTYGFVYMSTIEFEDFIKKQVKDNLSKEMNTTITDSLLAKIKPDFNYLDYIPFNYVMVDMKNKENNKEIKEEFENTISHTLATIDIENTASYTMYQGEIDEGKAYVGFFSGFFLFIALLSVITTMMRVVKREHIQTGTLKS